MKYYDAQGKEVSKSRYYYLLGKTKKEEFYLTYELKGDGYRELLHSI